MHSKFTIGLLALALSFISQGSAAAHSGSDSQPSAQQTFLTHQEALDLAFPKCKVERTTVFLTENQVETIAKAAQTTFTSTVVYPYIATKAGKLVGTAYFDTHLVRTLKETVMVVVDPKGQVSRVEVLAFGEPKQYIPSAKWYAQMVGLDLGPKLQLNKGVRNMTGATMTARASVNCARRLLALHAEINKPKPEPKPKDGEKKRESEDPAPAPQEKGEGKDPEPKEKEPVQKPKTQAQSQ
jgi:hypothetical protein